MNNQDVLNSCSVEEASAIISKALSEKKRLLEEKRNKLREDEARYKEDYVTANAHGDARENAQLDEAINNMRFVTGEIMANAKVLQVLENIEDVDYLISTYDWQPLNEAYSQLESGSRELFNSAIGMTSGDTLQRKISPRYNDEALLSGFDEFYIGVGGDSAIGADYNFIRELRKIRKVMTMPKYNHCGIVVPYSTVRLQLNKEIMTYRIYPEGLSFIDIGVMAANSRVAQAIMGRQKGDMASIQHASKPVRLEYHILDLF